jgi:hypothetical protein
VKGGSALLFGVGGFIFGFHQAATSGAKFVAVVFLASLATTGLQP